MTPAEALQLIADTFDGIDSESTWGSFTCGELDNIAEALRSTGHEATADFITEWHALGDDEGDDHYKTI